MKAVSSEIVCMISTEANKIDSVIVPSPSQGFLKRELSFHNDHGIDGAKILVFVFQMLKIHLTPLLVSFPCFFLKFDRDKISVPWALFLLSLKGYN